MLLASMVEPEQSSRMSESILRASDLSPWHGEQIECHRETYELIQHICSKALQKDLHKSSILAVVEPWDDVQKTIRNCLNRLVRDDILVSTRPKALKERRICVQGLCCWHDAHPVPVFWGIKVIPASVVEAKAVVRAKGLPKHFLKYCSLWHL